MEWGVKKEAKLIPKTVEGTSLRWRDQQFDIRHGKFEMPISVQLAVKYTNLQFR